MKSCKICEQPTDSIRSVIKSGKIYEGCDKCLPSQLQQGDSAKFDREWQKKEFRKELMQPNQRDYAKIYPDDFRKRHGDEAYRLYG